MSIFLHTHFAPEIIFDKNDVPWSNLEEMFVIISPLLESYYVHYLTKDWKKPYGSLISLALFKQHFLNVIIHRTLFSRNTY